MQNTRLVDNAFRVSETRFIVRIIYVDADYIRYVHIYIRNNLTSTAIIFINEVQDENWQGVTVRNK